MATGRPPEGSLGLLVTNAVLKITVITPQQAPPPPPPPAPSIFQPEEAHSHPGSGDGFLGLLPEQACLLAPGMSSSLLLCR